MPRVFVSSMISGFEEYRSAARDAIHRFGWVPVMSEFQPAQDLSPRDALLAEVARADVYLLLMGPAYGASSPPSPTEQEYEEAVRRGKPVIVLVQDGEREPAQQAFIDHVSTGWDDGRYRASFDSPAALGREVAFALGRIEKDMRGDDVGRAAALEADRMHIRAILEMVGPLAGGAWASSSDEVIRGPLKDPGIGDDLARATALVEDNPLKAAEVFKEIAARLRSRGFGPDADSLDQQAREALIAAGAFGDAFDASLEAALDATPRGLSQSPIAHALRDLVGRLDPDDPRRERYQAFDAWNSWAEAPEHFEPLRSAAARLQDRADPMFPRAALWLGEALLVDRQQQPTTDDLRILEAGIAGSEGQLALRLRMARVDLSQAGDRWSALEGEAANRDRNARDCAWIFTRAGRSRVRAGQPEEARPRYLRAVEFAYQAGLRGAISAALIDLANVALGLGDMESGDSLWRRARSVPDGDAYLPAAGTRLLSAITALAEGKAASAHGPLRGMLWEATVQGQRTEEKRIHKLLGELYERAEEWELASWHQQQAGEVKRARLSMGRSRNGPMPRAVSQEPGERAAAHSALSAVADRLPQEDAPQVCDELLEDLRFPQRSGFTPSVSAEAARALAASALLLSEEQLARALDFFEETIDRPKGHHLLVDESHALLLVVAYSARPEHRVRIGSMIQRGLKQDGLAEELIRRMSRIDDGQAQLCLVLRAEGDLGDARTRRALEALDEPLEPSDDEALRAAQAVLDRPPGSTRTSWTIGESIGISQVQFNRLAPPRQRAVLRRLMDQAQDTDELAMSRGEAVRAYVGLSAGNPALRSGDLFETLAALADPEAELSRIDLQHLESMHLLSHSRISFGEAELRAAAVPAAANVAHGPDESARAATLVRIAAASGQQAVIEAAAAGLVALAGSQHAPPAEEFALRTEPVLRRAAVWLWARSAAPARSLALSFAADAETSVRLTLAWALKEIDSRDAALAQEGRAILRSDRSASVRRAAAGPIV